MAKYEIPKNSKQLEWQVAMRRKNALPLDISSVFGSVSAAEKYLKGQLNDNVGVPYVGQIIAVEESEDAPMKVYCINSIGGTLADCCTELGEGKIKGIEVNDTPIAADDEGVIDITMTDKTTKIAETIEVNGGPLASLLTNAGITAITADMTVADVLSKLVRKETYPTPTYTNASISASITCPSVKVSVNGTVFTGDTIEVGTEVALEPMAFSATTISSSSVSKVGGLTYGYATDLTGDTKNTATSIESTNKTTGITDTYTKKITTTGFTAGNTTVTKPSDSTNVSLSSMNTTKTTVGKIVEGTNKIELKITGGTASVSCTSFPANYIVSNFGGRSESKKIDPSKASSTATKTPTNSNTRTITGKYMYFIGDSFEYTDAKDFDSNSIRALNKKTGFLEVGGETTAVDSTALKSDGGSIVVACPKGYTLKRIENGIGDELLSLFTSQSEISVETGSISTVYNVYVYPITNGAQVDFKNVVIGK